MIAGLRSFDGCAITASAWYSKSITPMNTNPTTFLLSDSELVELCTDDRWQVIRFDRVDGRYRVEAVHIETAITEPELTPRLPHADD